MSIFCGAKREIKLEFGAGDTGGDTYIIKADEIKVRNWIGGSGNFLIEKCHRCVGNPNRECDLSTKTWSELNPQQS